MYNELELPADMVAKQLRHADSHLIETRCSHMRDDVAIARTRTLVTRSARTPRVRVFASSASREILPVCDHASTMSDAFDELLGAKRGGGKGDSEPSAADSPLTLVRQLVDDINDGKVRVDIQRNDGVRSLVQERGLTVVEILMLSDEDYDGWEGVLLMLAAADALPPFVAVRLSENPSRSTVPRAELWRLDSR